MIKGDQIPPRTKSLFASTRLKIPCAILTKIGRVYEFFKEGIPKWGIRHHIIVCNFCMKLVNDWVKW